MAELYKCGMSLECIEMNDEVESSGMDGNLVSQEVLMCCLCEMKKCVCTVDQTEQDDALVCFGSYSLQCQ